MRMRTEGIHHIGLVTRDRTRSIPFYRDLLGLTLLRNESAGGARSYQVCFGDEQGSPGTLLALTEIAGGSAGRSGVGGVHHFALGTSDDAALLRWKRRLNDCGVPASGPYDRGYFTSLYFRDPDGQIVEIATEGPGYAIDEPADALGRETTYPPQRIIAGYRDEAAIAALTHPEPVREITREMKLSGIHHISAISPGLTEVGRFYEDVLGLSLVKRTINRDAPDVPHWFWANYRDGIVQKGSAFTIFGAPPSWSSARAGAGQASGVAFRAPDRDRLLAWKDYLLNRGVEVTTSVWDPAFESIQLQAPDGLQIHLATDVPGF